MVVILKGKKRTKTVTTQILFKLGLPFQLETKLPRQVKTSMVTWRLEDNTCKAAGTEPGT